MKLPIKIFLALISTITLIQHSASGSTSVKRHSITWHFSSNYQTGEFVNGDPWVKENKLGEGVTISKIDPAPTTESGRYKNGSMINPNPSNGQAYDSAGNNYDPSQRVIVDPSSDLPLTVKANSSIISTVGIEPASSRPSLKAASVLTVLPATAEPSSGDFRPPYVGTDKQLKWNIADIDWNKLPNLPHTNPDNVPALSELADKTERVWLLHLHTSGGRSIHPADNMNEYGRDLSKDLQASLLRLLLKDNTEDKKGLLINMLQIGIDIYGNIDNGMNYPSNGGHNQGMKGPLLFAGYMLNDSEMLWYSNNDNFGNFQEDESTFYVSMAEIELCLSDDWSPDSRAEPIPYTVDDLGMAEWGIRHKSYPKFDNKNWGATYRTVTGSATAGHALAISILGLQEEWNNPAFFEYYLNRYYPNSLEGKDAFISDMFELYQQNNPPTPPSKLNTESK